MVFGLPKYAEDVRTRCVVCDKEMKCSKDEYVTLVCDSCKKAIAFARKARAIFIYGSVFTIFLGLIILMFFTRNIFV